jgi:hypothetical protein
VRRIVIIGAVLILGAVIAWFALDRAFPVFEVHYRLDVTFEVEGKPVTGSGVQKLTVKRVRGLGQKKALWTSTGEAVIVELPERPDVFVLMASPRPDGTYSGGAGAFHVLLSNACRLKERRGKRNWSEFVRFVGTVKGACAVPEERLPLMVTFADEADPTSVERIFPNDPQSTLGQGVRFIGATVTLTDAPVTTGIGERLTWLSDQSEPRLTPNYTGSSKPKLADLLKRRYFRNINDD